MGGDLKVMRRLEAGGGWILKGTDGYKRQQIVQMGAKSDEVK